MLSTITNWICSLPVALTIWPVAAGAALRTPAARSARGLMSVRSAPVSSSSRTVRNSSAACPMPRSYRTPRQAIHDHFRCTRDLVALQAYPVDGFERFRARGHLREPCREDDHVLRTRFLQVPHDSRLPPPSKGNDLRRHEPHQVDDLTAREVGDRPDVVRRDPGCPRQVGVHP